MFNNMDEMFSKLYEYAVTYGLNLIAAVLIFAIGRIIVKILCGWMEKLMEKAHLDKTLASFLKNISYVTAMTFVIIAALSKLGVQTASFVAVIGAAGLAVGLALQGALANFAAGVILIIFKPFKIGDFIEAGGAMGTVSEIQIFNTILYTFDNRRMIVPNSKVTGDNITNFSAVDSRRVDLVFGISYDDDIKKAKDVLSKVLASQEGILPEPKPVIAVSELGDSSVNIVCRPWVKPQDYWNVYFALLEKGKLELEKNGITIPFPQRDVHIYNEKK